MQKLIKLSVIIPVYHAEEYLSRCLDSVLQCDMDAFEVIVVDDASTSECYALVAKYIAVDERVKYIRHELNKGLFEARYTGIEMATGEYLVHLDPDDWVDKKVYTLAYDRAKDTGSDVVLFNVEQCDEEGRRWIEPENVLAQFQAKSGFSILKHIFATGSNEWIWHVSWNKMIKTPTAKRLLPLFKKRKHLIMYEDLLWSVALFLEIGDQNRCASISHKGLNYFRHQNSITKRENSVVLEKKVNDIVDVFSNIKRLLRLFGLYERVKPDYLLTKANVLRMYFSKIPLIYTFKHPVIYFSIRSLVSRYNQKSSRLNMQMAAEKIVAEVLKKDLKEVTIYGTGELGSLLYTRLQEKRVRITVFVLSKCSNHLEYFHNVKVMEVEKAVASGKKCFVIASVGSCLAMKKLLQEYADKYRLDVISIGVC